MSVSRQTWLKVGCLSALSGGGEKKSELKGRAREGAGYSFQKGWKGAGVKGAGVANCRIFRSAVPSVVVWSILLVSLSGVKKKLWQLVTRAPLPPAPFADSWFLRLVIHHGGSKTRTTVVKYRHIQNYYLSNIKTFQDGNGNGDFGEPNSNDYQHGNWESMEMNVWLRTSRRSW